jgi:hypothetical protein
MSGNQAMERLSGNRIGLEGLVSDQRYPVGGRNVLSVAGGPTGGQLDNLAMLMKQLSRDGVSDDTLARLRRFVPGQAHPLADQPLDATMGD